MDLLEICAGKLWALRALVRMRVQLSNWFDVWSCYRGCLPLPPLRFRRGFVLHHSFGDDPIMLLHEIFAGRAYRHHIHDAVVGSMIDLGANIGAVTFDWASRSPALRIHAYEPNPKTHDTLRLNVQANGLADRINVYNEAVGRGFGEFKLWTNVPSLLATGYGKSPPAAGGIPMNVPMIDLNEVVRRTGKGPIALLKIDTEGAEADILEGATPATLKQIERLVLEYHNRLCPDALARCARVLDRASFRSQIVPANADQGLLYAWRNTL